MLLPGAGRDEALYVYWSRHPEPAYAPLLQLLTALFMHLPIPAHLAMRLPSLLGGVVVLGLFERWLRSRGVSYRDRLVALLALAVTPWQIYTGTILHPDSLLLACLLVFLIALQRERWLAAALAAALAFWSKPSGILLLPAALYGFWRHPALSARAAIFYSGVAVLGLLPVALSFRPEMIEAISEFSRIAPGISIGEALLLQIIAIVLLGGIFLPVKALAGLTERLKHPAIPAPAGHGERVALVVAAVFLGGFAGAALLFGQIKGNWILPAMVILWPRGAGRPPSPRQYAGVITTFLLGLATVTLISQPRLVSALEKQLPVLDGSYALQAGQREARVSATGSWSQRWREYQPVTAYLGQIQTAWAKHSPRPAPAWIVCDDYGLAAQTVFAWNIPGQRLVIPGDGVFINSLPAPGTRRLSGGVLVIAVHHPLAGPWSGLKSVREILVLDHPQGGAKVYIGISDGSLMIDGEW